MAYIDKEKQRQAQRESYLRTKGARIARQRAKRAILFDEVNALKLSRGCDRCGYNDHAVALDFHHCNGDKEFMISWGIRDCLPIEKIRREIEKCELVCSNCHRVETHKRILR